MVCEDVHARVYTVITVYYTPNYGTARLENPSNLQYNVSNDRSFVALITVNTIRNAVLVAIKVIKYAQILVIDRLD